MATSLQSSGGRVVRKAVPPNAVACCAVVEMPSSAAQVGTASVPTYPLRAIFRGHAQEFRLKRRLSASLSTVSAIGEHEYLPLRIRNAQTHPGTLVDSY